MPGIFLISSVFVLDTSNAISILDGDLLRRSGEAVKETMITQGMYIMDVGNDPDIFLPEGMT